MLLLEQDTSKKDWLSKKVPELDVSNKDSEEYKVETSWDSAVYANKLQSNHLPVLYYLVV